MKPWIHARNSIKHFGGVAEDYLAIHNWMDSTKAASANFYHRAILHNSFGPFIAEQVFGITITNSDGKVVSVRDIVEMHIKEDCCGRIPSLDEWLKDLPPKPWMLGRGQRAWVESQQLEAD
jgi:hypothetical protein